MDSREGGGIVTHRELSEVPQTGRLNGGSVESRECNGKSSDGFQGVSGFAGEKWSGGSKEEGVRMEPTKPSVLSPRWGP